jgi:hypothetical protein
VNGIDLVERVVSSALRENHGNVEAALQDLSEMGMFCNADATDLLPLLMRAAEAQEGE